MVSETTIIPQEIKVDGVTIDKNGTGQLHIKQTINNPIIKDLALNELNITILEVNATLSSVNDDFIENFVDADGLLGLVDTGNTTSFFNPSTKSYENDYETIDTTLYETGEINPTLQHTYTINEKLTQWNNLIHNTESSTKTVFNKIKFIYDDASSNEVTQSQLGNAETAKTYTNPEPTKIVSTVELYVWGDWDYGAILAFTSRNNTYVLESLSDKYIYLNYNKAKPTKTLLSSFSDSTGNSDVGSYTYELVHIGTAETTGELNPDVENTISMTNTPDRMIIHQKDTAVSKIKKFVLAVWE